MGSLPNVDRYVLESEIGRGGFGAVYRARHAVLDRKVALKVLHPQRPGSGNVLQRFLREAKAVAQLGSPHVVQVLDADMTPDGRAFIAMELLEGEDLAALLARSGRLPTHRAIGIAREILAGLTVAHAQGIVHRDLKPGNVFLARDARGGEVAKILDFGISKVRTEDPGEELTRTGTMLGTPHYMAPEQFRASRSVDGRADLYSLGTLLYEALTGRMPYEASTLEHLIAVKLSEPPRPLSQIAPDVPRAIGEVVMRALADDPKDRYQDAAEMDAALLQAESRASMPGVVLGRTPSVRPGIATPSGESLAGGTPATLVMPRRSRVVPVVAGIAGVLLVLAFTMLAFTVLAVWLAERELAAWLQPAAAPTSSAPPVAPLPIAPLRSPRPLASPQTSPSVPPPFPLPQALPLPDPGPGPDGAGVHIVTTAMGMADETELGAVADRARPRLARCRSSTAFHQQIQLVVMAGGNLHDGRRLTAPPSATRDCVVDALVGAGPVGGGSGIVRFTVTLDPT